MKTFLWAQLNPVKTMRQLIRDRKAYRAGLLLGIVVVLLV